MDCSPNPIADDKRNLAAAFKQQRAANGANFDDGESGLYPWMNPIFFNTGNIAHPSCDIDVKNEPYDYNDEDDDTDNHVAALCNVKVEIECDVQDEDDELGEGKENEGEVELIPNWIGHQMVDEDDDCDDDRDIGVIYAKPNRSKLHYDSDSDESFKPPSEDSGSTSTDSEFEPDPKPCRPKFNQLIVPSSLPLSTSPYVALKRMTVSQLRGLGLNLPQILKIFRNKDNRVACIHCGRKFVYKHSLKYHIQRKHQRKHNPDKAGAGAHLSQAQLFIDTGDGKSVAYVHFRNDMDYRLLDTTADGKLKCPVCNNVQPRAGALNAHIKGKHIIGTAVVAERQQNFNPIIVPSSLPLSTSPYVALKRMTVSQLRGLGLNLPEILKIFRKEDNRVACIHCGLKFASKYYLKEHIQRKHNPDKAGAHLSQDQLFIDTGDGKSVAYAHFRNDMDYRLLDAADGKLKCPVCNNVQPSAGVLNTHIKGKHIIVKAVVAERQQNFNPLIVPSDSGPRAPDVGLATSRLTFMNLDYRLLDLGDGKMKCPKCTKVLANRKKLKRHIKRIHAAKVAEKKTFAKAKINALNI